jgi:hypothetical protein
LSAASNPPRSSNAEAPGTEEVLGAFLFFVGSTGLENLQHFCNSNIPKGPFCNSLQQVLAGLQRGHKSAETIGAQGIERF